MYVCLLIFSLNIQIPGGHCPSIFSVIYDTIDFKWTRDRGCVSLAAYRFPACQI